MKDEDGIDVAKESKAEQSDNEQNIIVNMESSLAKSSTHFHVKDGSPGKLLSYCIIKVLSSTAVK